MSAVRIGTAGWSIPRGQASAVPGTGSHLERYANRLSCAEINSTFYRPSRESTWMRWFASVPPHFRFALKAPKTISHDAQLELTADSRAALSAWLAQAHLLGDKLGPLLFQLPPKQPFSASRAKRFFEHLRSLYEGAIALEPRHPSWFFDEADALLRELRIARVAADPPPVPEAAQPAGFSSLVYFRLHGSPRKYYSAYNEDSLSRLAEDIRQRPGSADTWVIFDNTASGTALGNALQLDAHFSRSET